MSLFLLEGVLIGAVGVVIGCIQFSNFYQDRLAKLKLKEEMRPHIDPPLKKYPPDLQEGAALTVLE